MAEASPGDGTRAAIERSCGALARQGGLTGRAPEIPAMLARGRSVERGEGDGNARARACDHKEEKVHHRARNADSGELQIARKAPEDKGVHRVVKLLQDIAHDERCG